MSTMLTWLTLNSPFQSTSTTSVINITFSFRTWRGLARYSWKGKGSLERSSVGFELSLNWLCTIYRGLDLFPGTCSCGIAAYFCNNNTACIQVYMYMHVYHTC